MTVPRETYYPREGKAQCREGPGRRGALPTTTHRSPVPTVTDSGTLRRTPPPRMETISSVSVCDFLSLVLEGLSVGSRTLSVCLGSEGRRVGGKKGFTTRTGRRVYSSKPLPVPTSTEFTSFLLPRRDPAVVLRVSDRVSSVESLHSSFTCLLTYNFSSST